MLTPNNGHCHDQPSNLAKGQHITTALRNTQIIAIVQKRTARHVSCLTATLAKWWSAVESLSLRSFPPLPPSWSSDPVRMGELSSSALEKSLRSSRNCWISKWPSPDLCTAISRNLFSAGSLVLPTALPYSLVTRIEVELIHGFFWLAVVQQPVGHNSGCTDYPGDVMAHLIMTVSYLRNSRSVCNETYLIQKLL